MSDSFNLATQSYAGGQGIATDSNGDLYVGGFADSSNPRKWIVRKKSANGGTWTTVDSYVYPGGFAQAQAIAIAPDRSIYVGGLGVDGPGTMYGVLRKSIDHGNSWSTIDSFLIASPHSGNHNGIAALAVDPSGVIYSAGSNGGWFVRKSSNNGTNWSTVDSYQLVSANAAATSIAIDGSGKIYVAGYGIDGSGAWNWIVRNSNNAGASWSTIDSYNYGGGYFAYPRGIACDSVGNVFVTGFEGLFSVGTFYPPSSWIVRKWSNSSGTWSTVDSSVGSLGNAEMGSGIAIDTSSNVYVAGATQSQGVLYWTVKKSADGGRTWSVVDYINGGWGANGIATYGAKVIVTGNQQGGWGTRIFSP